jgi:hypothetical protein
MTLISKLKQIEQQELFDDLNYLDTGEIKSFCKRHSIPYSISIETEDGSRKRTGDNDRKGVILHRVRHFLKTGVVLEETCFPATVVCFDDPPKKLTASNRLFYGQYDKTNRTIISLLKDLTDGAFEDGAVARILAREFWTRGEAPTFREFADAWLKARKEHTRPNPEWAFLSDRATKAAGTDWKRLRRSKAKKVLKILRDC